MQPVRVVLFDLGGVLVRFGGPQAMRELTGIPTDEEFWSRWLACTWVRSFEQGGCSPEQFAAGMVDEWSLDVTPERFLAMFRQWPTGLLPGAAELVQQVRERSSTGCLSNTNALHWTEHAVGWGLDDLFEQRFLSFELGLTKPDVAIFEHVVAQLEVPAGTVLLLDDNLLNVQAASTIGMRTAHVQGVEQARSALAEHALVTAAG